MVKSILAALALGLATVQFAAAQNAPLPAKLDFNGDGISELAIFDPATGAWFVMTQDQATYFRTQSLGDKTSSLVPGQYGGGAATHMGVFNNSSAYWSVRSMEELLWTKVTQFGYSGATPLACQLDADGKTDLVIYDKGVWSLMRTQAGFATVNFGFDGGFPLVADFDGDGLDDLVVVWSDKAAGGMQWAVRFANGRIATFLFGPVGSVPTPGHYMGSASANPAVYYVNSDTSAGAFYISRGQRGDASPIVLGLGGQGSTPVGGCDFDGDRKHDIAVYDETSGVWTLGMSTLGGKVMTFGYRGTVPVGKSLYEATGLHEPIIEPRSQGVVDGPGGFLWKPVSHGGGLRAGKLLVLWTTNIDPRGTIEKVVVSRDPAGEDVLDTLFDHGEYSSGRWKFGSHSLTGAGYGNDIYAVAIFNNGRLPKPYHIPTGADRWD